jgi:uncharacterized iron-regulated protein
MLASHALRLVRLTRPARLTRRIEEMPALPGATLRTPIGIVFLVLTTACAAMPGAGTGGQVRGEAPFRIYDPSVGSFISMLELAQNVAAADVVFFGEHHDDRVAQLAQRRLLEELLHVRNEGALGLEMFERDVQPVLDRYLRGALSERALLASARPWPNYRVAYRPLVELSRSAGWAVAATNLPQALASRVAREGLPDRADLQPGDREMIAEQLLCPRDEYWERFVEVFASAEGHAAHGAGGPETLFRMYEAQCARDETMAESIARLLVDHPFVMHVNGAFHTDFEMGIVPRLLRRRPGLRVAVISAQPVDDPSRPPLDEHGSRGDYLIFTPRPSR